MTEHFTISEMIQSETALKKRIWNGASVAQEKNMQALMENVLEPLRMAYGKPITITSGFRCPKLNKAVGGVSTSQHMTGEAADITGGSKAETRRLAKLIVSLGLPFDQLIDEKEYSWVHVSHKNGGVQRGKILRLTKKGTYLNIKEEEL